MGIPSFFKWLVNKYPGIVSPAEEEPAVGRDDAIIYDNLYLDMNCIIHPCFHPQDQLYILTYYPPLTLDEVFESMFDYMDHLLLIVRPTRLLYLAVDGVAPCAKLMRMQTGYARSARQTGYKECRAEGIEVPPQEISEVLDSNVITPGTEFMEKLSQALKYYIRARLNSDPRWKDIMVILSDANVPGEGEHKIMSFIRAQRSMEGYDPNTRHCFYGQDADLIMLALASHEVQFSILREDALRPNQEEDDSQLTEEYQFVNIWVLREYLEVEMKIPDPVCETDIERLIDDFIFICFLVGNDFIPNTPSLVTREFAVDLLIELYKTSFNEMGGYIVDTSKVKDKYASYLDVSRLEKFFHKLSMYEEKIFLKRNQLQQKLHRNILREASKSESLERVQELEDIFFNEEKPYDKIRLGLPGWKSRFFREYFCVETSNEIGKLKDDMAQKYLEGLCWALQCYFAGVPSWSWYYPFYSAPFVSDLKGLSRFDISFTVDKPLRPFDQLMAILPLGSWFARPEYYIKLKSRASEQKELKGCDESSRQRCFYPTLESYKKGKRFLWHGIPKSEFIDDQELLLLTTTTEEKKLAMHEMRRNTVRQEKIFVRNTNPLANNEVFVRPLYSSPQKVPIDSATSGIGGWLSPDDDDSLSSGFFGSPIEDLEDITNDQAISAKFFNPEAVNPIPRLLANARVPDKTVTTDAISKRPLWHTYPGSRPPPIMVRPDTIWKPSSPTTPREEHKNAGTGWIGRGRGNDTICTEKRLSKLSSYGHGVGNAIARQQRGSYNSYRRGFRGVNMAWSQGSSSSYTDGTHSSRPFGDAWNGGDGSGDGDTGHGGSGPTRAW